MKIQNTSWQTVAIKDKQNNDYMLGYEAPATITELRKLQRQGILVEVVSKTPGFRLIQPDNTDQQVFTPDQKFRIMETNKTFGRFEETLITTLGGYLTDDRFDNLVNDEDPNMWRKTDKGYCLKLSHLLSYEKKQALCDNLKGLATSVQTDRVFVEGKNIKALESFWKSVAEQRKSNVPSSLIQMKRGILR